MMTFVESEKAPTSQSIIQSIENNWIPIFGCPRAILSDRGSIFISTEFLDYVTQYLNVKLIHTSSYYPQGNGINESSHQILLHAISSQPVKSSNIQQIVQHATIAYNSSPHPSLSGHTPYSAIFGKDMILPGSRTLTPDFNEEVRTYSQRELQMRKMLTTLLANQNIGSEDTATSTIVPGDIVSFPLSPNEKLQFSHVSGCKKWAPNWSLPYRVTALKHKQATLTPLWVEGRERQAPVTLLKRFGPTIPRHLRDLVPDVLPARYITLQQEEDADPDDTIPIVEPPPVTEERIPRKSKN